MYIIVHTYYMYVFNHIRYVMCVCLNIRGIQVCVHIYISVSIASEPSQIQKAENF